MSVPEVLSIRDWTYVVVEKSLLYGIVDDISQLGPVPHCPRAKQRVECTHTAAMSVGERRTPSAALQLNADKHQHESGAARR